MRAGARGDVDIFSLSSERGPRRPINMLYAFRNFHLHFLLEPKPLRSRLPCSIQCSITIPGIYSECHHAPTSNHQAKQQAPKRSPKPLTEAEAEALSAHAGHLHRKIPYVSTAHPNCK